MDAITTNQAVPLAAPYRRKIGKVTFVVSSSSTPAQGRRRSRRRPDDRLQRPTVPGHSRAAPKRLSASAQCIPRMKPHKSIKADVRCEHTRIDAVVVRCLDAALCLIIGAKSISALDNIPKLIYLIGIADIAFPRLLRHISVAAALHRLGKFADRIRFPPVRRVHSRSFHGSGAGSLVWRNQRRRTTPRTRRASCPSLCFRCRFG